MTKPAVMIFRDPSTSVDSIESVLLGLEEEGIPFEIREAENGSVQELAKQAANASPLNVGMAVGRHGEIGLHNRELPAGMPLFLLSGSDLHPRDLRCLGMNAARLVKGQPLVSPDKAGARSTYGSHAEPSRSGLEELISKVLDEVAGSRGN
jgi:hypothetical protein